MSMVELLRCLVQALDQRCNAMYQVPYFDGERVVWEIGGAVMMLVSHSGDPGSNLGMFLMDFISIFRPDMLLRTSLTLLPLSRTSLTLIKLGRTERVGLYSIVYHLICHPLYL